MGKGFTLEEHLDNGISVVLGDPFFDLRVAKVIASRRAQRTGRVIVLIDRTSGEEVARFAEDGVPVTGSVKRMRAAQGHDEKSPAEPQRKTGA
jgi:hypothetical protein